MPLMWSVRRGQLKVRYNMPLMWCLSPGNLKVRICIIHMKTLSNCALNIQNYRVYFYLHVSNNHQSSCNITTKAILFYVCIYTNIFKAKNYDFF
jgi:hypothetical protein